MRTFAGVDEFVAAAGSHLGTSAWRSIDQPTIDSFAELTADRQWIHVDPVRAAAGPYGGPVAHGYLTLAMIPAMLTDIFTVAGVSMMVNRGANRIRFRSPVPAGALVRAVVRLDEARVRPRGYVEATLSVVMEVSSGPSACSAQLVLLLADQG